MSIVRILNQPIHTNQIYILGKAIIMNKETKLANLQKTSKVFAVISRILEIVSYVGAGISAASIIALYTNTKYMGVKIDGTDQIDNFFMFLSNIFDENTAWTIFLIVLAVLLVLTGLVMRKVGDLFRNINKNYSPFVPENVKLIKIIGIYAAIMALIEVGIVPAVLLGFLLWGVALLFDYGCELQTESDEII